MLAWLKANGYEKNSLEGQMEYMAHEAMTDKNYAPSREALMGANGENIGGVNRTLTRNFERPKENNFDDRRIRKAGSHPRPGLRRDGRRSANDCLPQGDV